MLNPGRVTLLFFGGRYKMENAPKRMAVDDQA
jgi:hypothetical protein